MISSQMPGGQSGWLLIIDDRIRQSVERCKVRCLSLRYPLLVVVVMQMMVVVHQTQQAQIGPQLIHQLGAGRIVALMVVVMVEVELP